MSIFSNIGAMFRLKKPVVMNFTSNSDDILNTKKALSKTGHYTSPEYGLTPDPDNTLYDGLKKFQQQNRLKIDGAMNPEGPTAKKLGQKIAEIDQKKYLFLKPKPVGKPKNAWWRSSSIPRINNEEFADNARAVKTLSGYSSHGEHPRWIAEDIINGDKLSVAKLADLLGQLEDKEPERANAYNDDIMSRLPTDKQNMLEAFANLRKSLLDTDKEEEPEEPEDPDEDEDKPEKPEKPEPDCTAEQLELEEVSDALGSAEAKVNKLATSVKNKKLEIEQHKADIAHNEQIANAAG